MLIPVADYDLTYSRYNYIPTSSYNGIMLTTDSDTFMNMEIQQLIPK